MLIPGNMRDFLPVEDRILTRASINVHFHADATATRPVLDFDSNLASVATTPGGTSLTLKDETKGTYSTILPIDFANDPVKGAYVNVKITLTANDTAQAVVNSNTAP